MSQFRADRGAVKSRHRTSQGFVKLAAAITRTGVLEYTRADGSVRRELRHPDDVFAGMSLSSMEGAPVTVMHPTALVDGDNYSELQKGIVMSDVATEGNLVTATLLVQDAETIAQIDSGELVELSPGYLADVTDESGTYDGQRYDARQRNIRYNHLSLLPSGHGRSGAEVSLRLDGVDGIGVETGTDLGKSKDIMSTVRIDSVDVEVGEAHVGLVERVLTERQDAVDARDKLQARVDQLEEDLLAAKVDTTRVDARVALLETAKKHLGAEYEFAGKTDHEVRVDACQKAGKDVSGKSEAYVEGCFDNLPLPNTQVAEVRQVLDSKDTHREDTVEWSETELQAGLKSAFGAGR